MAEEHDGHFRNDEDEEDEDSEEGQEDQQEDQGSDRMEDEQVEDRSNSIASATGSQPQDQPQEDDQDRGDSDEEGDGKLFGGESDSENGQNDGSEVQQDINNPEDGAMQTGDSGANAQPDRQQSETLAKSRSMQSQASTAQDTSAMQNGLNRSNGVAETSTNGQEAASSKDAAGPSQGPPEKLQSQGSSSDVGRIASNGSQAASSTANAATINGQAVSERVHAGSGSQMQPGEAPTTIGPPVLPNSKERSHSSDNALVIKEKEPTSPTYSTVKTPLAGPGSVALSGSSIQSLEVRKHIYALQIPTLLAINAELVRGSLALQAQHAKNNPEQPAHPMEGLYKESVLFKLCLRIADG